MCVEDPFLLIQSLTSLIIHHASDCNWIFHKSDFYLRGNSVIMSVDDKSSPLVYTQKITNSIMDELIYSLLGNKVPQALNLPYINVGKL